MGKEEPAMNNKNRIMIYGPKTDGTYIVEFKSSRWGGAGDLSTTGRDGSAEALSGSDALRAVRAGPSVREPLVRSNLPRLISCHGHFLSQSALHSRSSC
jgi:hypothetical protein